MESKIRPMKFGYTGINYKNASLAIRDHISFTENVKIDFMQKADIMNIHQCLILATCNRCEVFFFYESDEEYEFVKNLYRESFPEVDFTDLLLCKKEEEALSYLFRIAAGLESAVLGEDQILGQLKDALMLSRALGYCKKEMNRVVENAMATAKTIKTKYKVSEIPLSVSYIGIKELERRTGFDGKRVLMVGSGATAILSLKYVFEYPVESVTVCSRNYIHAKELKKEFPEIHTVPYEERYDRISQSDIVISATSSPHFAIEAEKCCINEPVVFLDLAAPRDVEPEVCRNEKASIINLDLLDDIAKQNQKERERLIELCREELDLAVKETGDWLFESRVDATISSLNQRCDEITEESFTYLQRKLSLSVREQKILKKIIKASLKKLIREPILELKKLESEESQAEYTRLLNEMFHLTEQSDTAVLVASFGTINADSRKKTIDLIEQEFAENYGNGNVFCAITSEYVAKKTNKPLVDEVMNQIKERGFKKVLIQPTHLLKGSEYQMKLLSAAAAYENVFEEIRVGAPLLADESSLDWMADFLIDRYRRAAGINAEHPLVLVGHGSNTPENAVYQALWDLLKAKGCKDIYIGTVEGSPDVNAVVSQLKRDKVKAVVLAPFLLVAGSHARKDLAGDNENSWNSVLNANGIQVTNHMVALGELCEIRKRYLERSKCVLNQKEWRDHDEDK